MEARAVYQLRLPSRKYINGALGGGRGAASHRDILLINFGYPRIGCQKEEEGMADFEAAQRRKIWIFLGHCHRQ